MVVSGITLASQWKSQFDDSEETTDNEWKGENLPSPEHRNTPTTQVRQYCLFSKIVTFQKHISNN